MNASNHHAARGVDYSAFAVLRLHLVVVAFLLGALAMAGWILGDARLRSFLTGSPEMKANTALCLMLPAVAMAFRKSASGSESAVSNIAATLAGMIGVLTLIEYSADGIWGLTKRFAERVPPLSGRRVWDACHR